MHEQVSVWGGRVTVQVTEEWHKCGLDDVRGKDSTKEQLITSQQNRACKVEAEERCKNE